MSDESASTPPTPHNGTALPGVKIRKRDKHGLHKPDRYIDTKKVDKIMRCLRALMDEAGAGHISEEGEGFKREFIIGTNAVLQLRYHCESPDMKIDPKVFGPNEHGDLSPSHILHQMIQGDTIGGVLFGAGWKEKIKNNEALTVPDPDVRDVITAAKPKVGIYCYNPVDQDHALSAERIRIHANHVDGVYLNAQHASLESGESLREMPAPPGIGWVNRCRPSLKQSLASGRA